MLDFWECTLSESEVEVSPQCLHPAVELNLLSMLRSDGQLSMQSTMVFQGQKPQLVSHPGFGPLVYLVLDRTTKTSPWQVVRVQAQMLHRPHEWWRPFFGFLAFGHHLFDENVFYSKSWHGGRDGRFRRWLAGWGARSFCGLLCLVASRWFRQRLWRKTLRMRCCPMTRPLLPSRRLFGPQVSQVCLLSWECFCLGRVFVLWFFEDRQEAQSRSKSPSLAWWHGGDLCKEQPNFHSAQTLTFLPWHTSQDCSCPMSQACATWQSLYGSGFGGRSWQWSHRRGAFICRQLRLLSTASILRPWQQLDKMIGFLWAK